MWTTANTVNRSCRRWSNSNGNNNVSTSWLRNTRGRSSSSCSIDNFKNWNASYSQLRLCITNRTTTWRPPSSTTGSLSTRRTCSSTSMPSRRSWRMNYASDFPGVYPYIDYLMFTDHNRFFGWVHNFKIGEANLFFGDNNKRPPYPPIVINPTVRQVFANWNIADTGLLVTGTMIGALLARRQCKYSVGAPISAEKTLYYLFFNSYLSIAVFLGMQNSFYRLVGLNPNGLNW